MSFRNDMFFSRDSYIGRALSKAYIPTKEKNPNEYYALVKELGILFDENSKDGMINMPSVTKSFTGKV